MAKTIKEKEAVNEAFGHFGGSQAAKDYKQEASQDPGEVAQRNLDWEDPEWQGVRAALAEANERATVEEVAFDAFRRARTALREAREAFEAADQAARAWRAAAEAWRYAAEASGAEKRSPRLQERAARFEARASHLSFIRNPNE